MNVIDKIEQFKNEESDFGDLCQDFIRDENFPFLKDEQVIISYLENLKSKKPFIAQIIDEFLNYR